MQLFLLDLFAIAVGFGVISFTIAASRDAFLCMTYGGTRLVALKIHVIFFLWVRNLVEVLSFVGVLVYLCYSSVT